MTDEIAAIGLATHALLVKLMVELMHGGQISEQQVISAITSARRILEEGGDTVGLQAGLRLETLHDDLFPDQSAK